MLNGRGGGGGSLVVGMLLRRHGDVRVSIVAMAMRGEIVPVLVHNIPRINNAGNMSEKRQSDTEAMRRQRR